MPGGMREPDGIVGGDGIKIGGGDVTVFSELAFVPTGADDPLAGLNNGEPGFHTRDDFSH